MPMSMTMTTSDSMGLSEALGAGADDFDEINFRNLTIESGAQFGKDFMYSHVLDDSARRGMFGGAAPATAPGPSDGLVYLDEAGAGLSREDAALLNSVPPHVLVAALKAYLAANQLPESPHAQAQAQFQSQAQAQVQAQMRNGPNRIKSAGNLGTF